MFLVYSFSNLLSYLFMRTDSTFLGVKGQSCHTCLGTHITLFVVVHTSYKYDPYLSPFSIQQRPFRATTKGVQEGVYSETSTSTGASSQWPAFLLNRFPLPWSPCSSSFPPRPSPATPTCSRTSASRISRPVSSYLNSFFSLFSSRPCIGKTKQKQTIDANLLYVQP